MLERDAERRLLALSRAGDRRAFGQLVARYEDRIFAQAHRVCAAMPSEAEGVAQDTLVTALRKIGQFREDASLGTWLHRIAANLCWMRLRRLKRQVQLSPAVEERAADEDGPEQSAAKAELRRAVSAALGRLPAQARLVVLLKDVEELSNAQISRRLGLSLPAVKSRLHRGRLSLKRELDAIVSAPQGR